MINGLLKSDCKMHNFGIGFAGDLADHSTGPREQQKSCVIISI
jgi:hypothetical protein